MNPIQKALSDIHFRIPEEILDTIFTDDRRGFMVKARTVDELIRKKVIEPRVLVDCNLRASTLVAIPIDNLTFEQKEYNSWTVRVPKELTQGRSIVSLSGITFFNPRTMINNGFTTNFGGGMMNNMRMMMASDLPVPNFLAFKLDLVGENVILIEELNNIQPNMWLYCHIANDENLSNLRIKFYSAFSTLVTYAVKAYIYNNHIVKMDMAEIRGGVSIGRFKEIVDGYSDAEELYMTYLDEHWRKKAMMNDTKSHTRFLNSLIAAGR